MKIREFDIDFHRQANYEFLRTSDEWPPWQFDERQPCGINYQQTKHVKQYDQRHQRFRNYESETRDILSRLELDDDSTVIDLGCGTGAFVLPAASQLKQVYAVDISKAMLRRLKSKARKQGQTNIEYCQAGFLTYQHKGDPVDAIVCVAALHHLPDFWKLVALQRMRTMLKPEGKLYLADVVYQFDWQHYRKHLCDWINSLGAQVNTNELVTHVKAEFSTCDWIMEGLLERAGFTIEQQHYQDHTMAHYCCVVSPA